MGAHGEDRPRRITVGVLSLLILLSPLAPAACGGSSGSGDTGGSGDGGSAAVVPSPAAADYAKLLTQEDVRAITGRADATPMPESDWRQREGTSKYFAIYQGKGWDEALWLRVGHAGMFEEQRGASNTTEKTEGLGDDAFWWDYTGMDRGIAILAGDATYIISTQFRGEKPQLSDAQLMEVAKTIVGRL
jgi:hypothetical protein